MPVITDPPLERGEDELGAWTAALFSDAGGLTQLGAFLETLAPGAASSRAHWHTSEDEMVFMLEGIVTVCEGEDRTPLTPGQAACFKADTPIPHRLVNESKDPARYLVIGTRSGEDFVTYADGGSVTIADGLKTYRDAQGNVIRTAPYHRTQT